MTPVEYRAFLTKLTINHCERDIERAVELLPKLHKFQRDVLEGPAGGGVPNDLFRLMETLHRADTGRQVLKMLTREGKTIFDVNRFATKTIRNLASHGSRSADPYCAIIDRHIMESWQNITEAFQFEEFAGLEFGDTETHDDLVNDNT